MTTVTLDEVTLHDVRKRLEKMLPLCDRWINIHLNTVCGCEVFDDLVNQGSDIGMAKVFALIKHVIEQSLADLEEDT